MAVARPPRRGLGRRPRSRGRSSGGRRRRSAGGDASAAAGGARGKGDPGPGGDGRRRAILASRGRDRGDRRLSAPAESPPGANPMSDSRGGGSGRRSRAGTPATSATQATPPAASLATFSQRIRAGLSIRHDNPNRPTVCPTLRTASGWVGAWSRAARAFPEGFGTPGGTQSHQSSTAGPVCRASMRDRPPRCPTQPRFPWASRCTCVAAIVVRRFGRDHEQGIRAHPDARSRDPGGAPRGDRLRGSEANRVGRRAQARHLLGDAQARLRDPSTDRGRLPLLPVPDRGRAPRRARPQPADRRRGAALPDLQG